MRSCLYFLMFFGHCAANVMLLCYNIRALDQSESLRVNDLWGTYRRMRPYLFAVGISILLSQFSSANAQVADSTAPISDTVTGRIIRR
jgi:hypothetical protein